MQFNAKALCLLLSGLISLQPVISHPSEMPQLAPRSAPLLMDAKYPKTKVAGVTVVDTPIVRAARAYTRAHSTDFVYKHSMRSWIFGSLIIAGNSTLRNTVDVEVQAVASLLHDLGWDRTPNSEITSPDRRFEVDGAIASRKFLERNADKRAWDARRIQLVWDAIALHTTRTIAYFKEPEVAINSMGISVDFDGLKPGITQNLFDQVIKTFPNDDLKQGTNETLIWLCQTKENSTYDTWQQPWGEHYVPGYKSEGNIRFYHIFDHL